MTSGALPCQEHAGAWGGGGGRSWPGARRGAPRGLERPAHLGSVSGPTPPLAHRAPARERVQGAARRQEAAAGETAFLQSSGLSANSGALAAGAASGPMWGGQLLGLGVLPWKGGCSGGGRSRTRTRGHGRSRGWARPLFLSPPAPRRPRGAPQEARGPTRGSGASPSLTSDLCRLRWHSRPSARAPKMILFLLKSERKSLWV